MSASPNFALLYQQLVSPITWDAPVFHPTPSQLSKSFQFHERLTLLIDNTVGSERGASNKNNKPPNQIDGAVTRSDAWVNLICSFRSVCECCKMDVVYATSRHLSTFPSLRMRSHHTCCCSMIETRVHAPGVPFMSPVDAGQGKEKEQALGEGNVENPQGLGFPSRGRRRTQYDRSPFMVSSVAKG